ncbi:MAG: TolC family protein [Fuerstiella sp.]
MPKCTHRSVDRRTRSGAFFLSVVAVGCIVGFVYLACFSPEPLLATPEEDGQAATSIRLGLPTFAFREDERNGDFVVISHQSQSGSKQGNSAQQPGFSWPSSHRNSGAIQITPGTSQQRGQIQIMPRKAGSANGASMTAGRGTWGAVAGQNRFYSTSQQADPNVPQTETPPAKADEFWKSIVNGPATRINETPEGSGKPAEQQTKPSDEGDKESQMRLPRIPFFDEPEPNASNIKPSPGVRSEAGRAPSPQQQPPTQRFPAQGFPAQRPPTQIPPTPPLPPQQPIQMPSPSMLPQPPLLMDEGATDFGGRDPLSLGGPAESFPAHGSASEPSFSHDSNAPLGAHSIPSIQPASPSVTSGHSFSQTQPGMSGFRATVEKDASDWISPYALRADQTVVALPSDIVPSLEAMPATFRPWWDSIVRQAVNPRAATMEVNVSNLIQDALLYSPQVVAIQAEPEVKYRIITQEAARFDWTAFLETTYNDLNEPVGNELTTGNGQDRLLTRQWQFSSGVRRRNSVGGEFQATQNFGHENQNSRFFIPNNQASSRLELSYRQPLLDGAGQAFNQSEIVLARIEANSSEDEVVDALQDHLIEVTTAYWTLYRARSEFFQRQKLLISSQDVLDRLTGRAAVDTIPRQILRAQAAVARAKTGIRRTLARVKDAEAQLRLLVNSPGMLNGGPTELLPFEAPVSTTESADLRTILQTALFNRADISAAIRQMRSAGVRLGVSKQELLPRLDVLVSGYVADLSGGSDLGSAIRGKYLDNRPGYSVGLEFEMPLGNRAARARNEQRQWELKRAINVFRATVEKSLTDVEIGRREVETSHAEMTSRYHSMSAANQESIYLKDRFQVFPEAEDSATLLLEDLLASFERLADEESAFVRAQVDHALSLIDLKKQMGTLLRSRHDRPAIDGAHQQWVQDRLRTHAPAAADNQPAIADSSAIAPSTKTPTTIAPTNIAPSGAGATTAVGPASFSGSLRKSTARSTPRSAEEIRRLRAEATAKSGIQQMSAKQYESLYVPRGEPIPAHPTTWKRSPLNQ